MRLLAVCALSLLIIPSTANADSDKRFTVDDMLRLKRVSDPQLSPDGKQVAYVIGEVDWKGNRIVSNIWLAPATGDAAARPLTKSEKNSKHPRWSPDGKAILFESNRSGESQLWLLDPLTGDVTQLTTISTGASDAIWSPDGKHIAFVSTVWPEFSTKPFKDSDALNKQRLDEEEKSPVKARVFTRLFFRHWDSYVQDKRQHLFVLDLKRNGDKVEASEPRDVTPGDRDAFPTSMTFASSVDFTFSPDSKYLVFTAVPEKDEAWSTNYDICRTSITGGKIETLSAANTAADGAPQFAPSGNVLAFRAQKTPRYEADRWQLMVVPTDPSGKWLGEPRSLSADFDSSIDSFVWWDNNTLLLTAEKEALTPLWRTTLDGKIHRAPVLNDAVPRGAGTVGDLNVSASGKRLAFTLSSFRFPNEVFTAASPDGPAIHNVSKANVVSLEKGIPDLNMPRPESVTVKGAGGDPMQMWILKPPGFDAAKKWPLVYLVHGGPQGAWTDGWSYRWNPEVWAAQGYVVAMPNPRGSTGFGQKYVDEISGDWGGKCYEDLMAGVAYLEKQPYIDDQRLAAAGASFGGYMMNWFQGNTTKFKTLISHCGVFNFESCYATTEELWFDEWDHGGPPWGNNRHSYEKHSPHRLAKNFKTPMLVIHNDLDFRVPISEGLQLFTTLQRMEVPSRMINFPDEGHWVLKPRNSEYWHQEVFAWLKKWTPPGGR